MTEHIVAGKGERILDDHGNLYAVVARDISYFDPLDVYFFDFEDKTVKAGGAAPAFLVSHLWESAVQKGMIGHFKHGRLFGCLIGADGYPA